MIITTIWLKETFFLPQVLLLITISMKGNTFATIDERYT